MLASVAIFALTSLCCAPLQTNAQTANPNNIPEVSLLVDNAGYNTSSSLRSLLPEVSRRKGRPFYFGVAYDPGTNFTLDAIMQAKLNDTFNHGVAENFCKWVFTEPFPNVTDLTACKRAQSFYGNNSASFRVAQLVWHIQLPPSWLPGDFSAQELENGIIPDHVAQVSSGMGPDYISVDVLNELVADSASYGDSPFECIRKKMVWPTVQNDSSTIPLLTDLTFVENAMAAASNNTRAPAYLNDYNIGGINPKTECYYNLATHLQSKNIAFGGIGFQSHVSATPFGFDNKTALKTTFKRFAELNLDAPITEFDVWLQDDTIYSQRWQAAIYGDYLDACLYSSNCNEFVIWGLDDANSWLNTYPGNYGIRQPLLFDFQGDPKLNYYELKARMRRFIANAGEVCDSASGVSVCDLTKYPASQLLMESTSSGSASSSPSLVSRSVSAAGSAGSSTSAAGSASSSASAVGGSSAGSAATPSSFATSLLLSPVGTGAATLIASLFLLP